MELKQFPYGIKKVAVYVRKSREDDESKKLGIDTLEEQLNEMKRMVDSYDVEYDIFQEVVSGESIEEREEFKKLLLCIENREDINGGSPYHAIVCRDSSRLTRGGGKDQQTIVDIVTDYTTFIIMKSGKIYNPEDRYDHKQLRMESFFNHEFYHEVNFLLTNGRYRTADDGFYPTGSVPYGFKLQSMGKHKKPVPIEEEKEIVKYIFDLYVNEDLRERGICTKLKRKGIKTRNNKWFTPVVVRRMLRNESYIGTLTYGKTKRRRTDKKVVQRPEDEWVVVEDAFEPIIDKDTFYKAKDIMENPKKKSPIKMDFKPNELAGIVRCECGKKMVRNTSPYKYKKKDGTVTHYNRYFLVCLDCSVHGSVFIKYYDIEKRLLQVLEKKIELKPSTLKKEVENHLAEENEKKKTFSNSDFLERLEGEKEKVLESIDRLYNQQMDNKILPQIFERQLDLRQKDLVEIENRIKQVNEEIKEEVKEEKEDIDPSEVKKNIKTIIDFYTNLEDKEKRNELLRNLFEEVHLHLLSKKPKEYDLYVRLDYALLSE